MRAFAFLLACAACAAPRARPTVAPDALRGMSILVPAATDARRSEGVGCGFVAQDLALRTNKLVVQSLGEAGATLAARPPADYTLTVTLRDAAMGAENEGRRRSDRPVEAGEPDAPSLGQPQVSAFNQGNDKATVVLDATLTQAGKTLWMGTVTGTAQSAPCMQTMGKVREALQDAVDQLRTRLIRLER